MISRSTLIGALVVVELAIVMAAFRALAGAGAPAPGNGRIVVPHEFNQGACGWGRGRFHVSSGDGSISISQGAQV